MGRHFLSASSACAAMILLQACAIGPHYEQNLRVRSADEAGSVTVSPISVTRWEDVASDLEPKFKMDSATALAEALPTTQSVDQRISDVLSGNLRVALPTTTSVRTTTEETDAETSDLITTVSNSRTRTTGDPSRVDQQALAPGTAAALAALTGSPTGQDPMLRYLAATALQQEVALLNRYIRDRIAWPGSQAFLVRMQLAVIPHGRTLPYDVETDITLHGQDVLAMVGLAQPDEKHASPVVDGGGKPGVHPTCSSDRLNVLPMVVTDNLERQQVARSTDSVRQLALALLATAGNVGASGGFARTRQELERTEGKDANSLLTISKLSEDTVRVRLGAVQSARYEYVTVPRTHNISLVVVYRPCPEPTEGQPTVPSFERAGRNKLDEPKVITAVTRTTFRDAMTGRALGFRNATERLNSEIHRIRGKYLGQFTYLELARMYQWTARQENRRFIKYVVGKHPDTRSCRNSFLRTLFGVPKVGWGVDPEHYRTLIEGDEDAYRADVDERTGKLIPIQAGHGADRAPKDPGCLTLSRIRYETVAAALWTELQSIRPTGEFAYANIPITLRSRVPTLPVAQTALISHGVSDGTVTLPQGRDLAELKEIQMTLISADAVPKRIPALEAGASANGRAITGRFPALMRYGIKNDAGYTLEIKVPLDRTNVNLCGGLPPPIESVSASTSETAATECVRRYPVQFFSSAPAEASTYTLAATASGIVADPSGRGRLNVIVRRSKTDAPASSSLFLTVDGAELVDVKTVRGLAVVSDVKGWRVTELGEATLLLENLIPNTAVKVTLEEGERSAGTLSRGVVALAQPVQR